VLAHHRQTLRRATLVALLLIGRAAQATAQTPSYHAKLTLGAYTAQSQVMSDVNLRYSVRQWTGWVGWYGPQRDVRQTRAGVEYDLRTTWVTLIPSLQVASKSFVGGSVYSEIGRPVYLVAGVSRTNLQPYVNLTFDPNESWQLGGGVRFLDTDSVTAFTIWDNRLHTGQRNSHLVVRHYFAGQHRVTVDASYKSGLGDVGGSVHGGALGVEFDWHRWFVKAARDAHVNYTAATMWRFGGGIRF
jgi:hypothetical protein